MIAGLLAVLIYGGQFGWNAFVGLLVLLALWEWNRLTGVRELFQIPLALFLFAILIFFYFFFQLTWIFPIAWLHRLNVASVLDYQAIFLTLSTMFWLFLAPLALRHVGAFWLNNSTMQALLALLLIGAAGVVLIHARQVGVVFLLSMLVVVWIADIAAYFSGKAFGQNQLAPKISPGKTWEGACGGVAAVLIYGWLWVCLANYMPAEAMPFNLMSGWPYQLYSRWNASLFTFWLIVLTALSILGDLFESLLKRRIGLKDSSQILPGHGGILDRIDAQLAFLPLAILLFGTPK